MVSLPRQLGDLAAEANAMANISECLSKAAEFQSRAAIVSNLRRQLVGP